LNPPIGKLLVGTVCPSFAKEPVNAVPMSESVLLAHVELIVVPPVTGLPAGSEYVPEPLRAIFIP
jgi:hypothetical protein